MDDLAHGSIRDRALSVMDRVRRAEERAGRPHGSVRIVAVSKTRGALEVLEAFSAGIVEFGENYVQEAEAKAGALPAGILLHMVGGLQSNKARRAARIFSMVQGLDSESAAAALDRACRDLGRRMDVLVQVNVASEATKGGVGPDGLADFLGKLEGLSFIKPRGIMVIPPAGLSARYFPEARRMFERARQNAADPASFDILSMGMSADFEEAISEGAVIVRIGRAIFGER